MWSPHVAQPVICLSMDFSGKIDARPTYNTSEPNSPLLARVRIFTFGLTTALFGMIW